MRASAAGEFDCVVVDKEDRLARGWRLLKAAEELHSRGQRILDCRGYDSTRSSILSYVNAGKSDEDAKEIKFRTRRGLRERHLNGFSAGGRAYGYASEAVDPNDPKRTKWRKVIDPETAPVVLEIHEMYGLTGASERTIAETLNNRDIPSPAAEWKRKNGNGKRTDGKWMYTSVRGILRNEIYAGTVIWNQCRWDRIIGTNRRRRVRLPEHQWERQEHPELRIVPEELWNKVQARVNRPSRHTPKQSRRGRQPKFLVSGLLKCPECHCNYIISNKYEYSCSSHRGGGPKACSNDLRVKRKIAEERILSGVTNGLLREDVIAEVEAEMIRFAQELASQAAKTSTKAGELARTLAEVEKKIANTTSAIVNGGLDGSPALADALRQQEAQKQQLTAELGRAQGGKLDKLPGRVRLGLQRYRAKVAGLATLPATAPPGVVEEARGLLRRLLGDVYVRPSADGPVAELETTGARLLLAVQTNLVAGVGFEPTTFGL